MTPAATVASRRLMTPAATVAARRLMTPAATVAARRLIAQNASVTSVVSSSSTSSFYFERFRFVARRLKSI